MTDEETKLLAIVRNHAGLARAISLPDVSERMGFGRDKNGTRRVQQLKRALVELGYPIGSSSAPVGGGYYLMVSQAEIEATLKQYNGRFFSTSVLIKKTKALLLQPESPQQTMSWGE